MRERSDADRGAARIALIYALLGMLWILFSDSLLLLAVNGEAERFARLQTWKGWFFVLSTAVLLYFLVRGTLARQFESERALQSLNADLEHRVAERTAQLEVANRELEAFSYSVSHDLKSPLRGIDGYSQILLLDHAERLDEDGRKLLGNIRGGVAHMHALIEDMLAYSRAERRPVDVRQLDLDALVRTVLDSRLSEEDVGRVEIRLDVPPLKVRADREGVTLALRNLLENALKFSAGRERPRIELGARDEGTHVVFWIRDNGIGFDMKYHDRIFDIFQRLHRAEDYPGTGVGLALVKKAVNRMGGRVRAESAPGEGAAFFVELPK